MKSKHRKIYENIIKYQMFYFLKNVIKIGDDYYEYKRIW